MAGLALVLGGGGITGLAWQAGLVAGLARGGVDLSRAETVLGTSAGSIAGVWVASGRDPEAALGPPAGVGGGAGPDPEPARVAQMWGLWTSIERYRPEDGAAIGAVAREAATAPEADWVARIEAELGTTAWPPHYRATAIDAHTGEILLFGAGDGVALERAVAASCAVPAIAPAVRVGGRLCTDGSLPTGTHADRVLEQDASDALIVAPFDAHTPGLGPLMERTRREEEAALRAAGVRVAVIRPSREAREAMGPFAMDASRREASIEAGLAQGLAEARRAALDPWRPS